MTKVTAKSFIRITLKILFNIIEFLVAFGAAFYAYNYVVAWNTIVAIVTGVSTAALVLEITGWLKGRIRI